MNENTNQNKTKTGAFSLILGLPVTFIVNVASIIFTSMSFTEDQYPGKQTTETLLNNSHTASALAVVGLIVGLLAIITSIMTIKKNNAKKGMAIAGMIFGIIGAIVAVILLIISIMQGSNISNYLKLL